MDFKFKQEIIHEAQKLLIDNPRDIGHDITHIYRVVLLAKEISGHVDEDFDEDILEIVCWWHDVQLPNIKLKDDRMASFVAKHVSQYFDGEKKEIVFDSIKNHEWSMKPNFVEGKILFDADKLEVPSMLRIKPVIEAVKQGYFPKKRVKEVVTMILYEWLPQYDEKLHFDYSKKLFEKRKGPYIKVAKEYLSIL
jgi:HD superfamily phosphodiesterase